jgi:hypothetical protein
MNEHQSPVEGGPNPCPHCPPIPTQARMDKIICVGFGNAEVTCDGRVVIDGERAFQTAQSEDDLPRFRDAEALAVADPDHDWRVILNGPLHGETYQRQGPEVWICIERNEGFA